MSSIRSLFLGLFVFISITASAAIDFAKLEKDLTGSGLEGWIHGAANDLSTYVFTWRGKSFFESVELSLIPADSTVAAALAKATRHDQVRVFGSFETNRSAQKHILVTKLETIAAFSGPTGVPPFEREAKLPDDLAKLKTPTILATVHAIAAGGEVLVIEYKGAVVPVYVLPSEVAQTRGLYRGDKIELKFFIRRMPKRPVHLGLDASRKPSIKVIEPILDVHGKDLILEGPLVYFPKSPQLKFGVFAVQVEDADGLKLNYTLVNQEDEDVFAAILKKLETAWKAAATTAVNGRNCLVNPKLRVRATGKGQVISPSQANPQILLDGEDDVEILP